MTKKNAEGHYTCIYVRNMKEDALCFVLFRYAHDGGKSRKGKLTSAYKPNVPVKIDYMYAEHFLPCSHCSDC